MKYLRVVFNILGWTLSLNKQILTNLWLIMPPLKKVKVDKKADIIKGLVKSTLICKGGYYIDPFQITYGEICNR